MKIVINAKDLVLGRLASFAAKQAMEGNEVDIINSEKAIITGTKAQVLSKYQWRRKMGDPHHGPFFPREPELIVRRTIRGMLPYKQTKGKIAYKNVRCHLGIPNEFKDKEFITYKNAELKESTIKYIKLGVIAQLLGSNHGN